MPNKRNAAVLAAALAALSLSSATHARVPVMDGTKDAEYPAAFAVQTVNTGFGDNQSELDAGYLTIQNGKLNLMITGNVESNFNKLVFFFDTRAGGQNVMRADNPDIEFNNLNTRYAGMTFDSAFEPDYVMWVTRGFNSTTQEFEVFSNFSELNTNGGGFGAFLGRLATAAPNQTVSGTFGGGNAPTVEFGYNDSNTLGVVGDVAGVQGTPANQTDAAAVTTGAELSIDLSQLGATENFKMMIGVNGSNHDFWSNQFLPGLTPVGDPLRQGNLGSDGNGVFVPPGSVSAVNFNLIAGDQFNTVAYHAPIAEWNDGNGSWLEQAKWTGDGVPNAPDARAILGTLGGAGAKTITLDTNVRVQSIVFDNPGGYTINAGARGVNNLSISGNPASESVRVVSGNHTINAPVVLLATTNFAIASGSQLSITGDLTATGITVVKTGAGTLQVNNVRAAGINAVLGVAKVAANGGDAGTSKVNSVSTSAGGYFDVNDNDLVVGGGTATPDVIAQIVTARNGGGWDGANGITSSAARAHPQGATTLGAMTGLEYSSIGGGGVFSGQTYVDTDTLVKYTWLGDADFNGEVNFDDYIFTDGGFNNGLSGWLNGDFDLSGGVDFDDYILIDLGFNSQSGTLRRAQAYLDGTDRSESGMDDPALQMVEDHFQQFGTEYARGFLSAVPEPAAAAVVGLASLAGLCRRRRRGA